MADTAITHDQAVALAAARLADDGLRVLDTNWEHPHGGTIDIVAARNGLLVACMVIVAPSVSDAEAELWRAWLLRQLAIRWLVAQAVLFEELRVDVVIVPDSVPTGPVDHRVGVA